jgi:hypothetical protein
MPSSSPVASLVVLLCYNLLGSCSFALFSKLCGVPSVRSKIGRMSYA